MITQHWQLVFVLERMHSIWHQQVWTEQLNCMVLNKQAVSR